MPRIFVFLLIGLFFGTGFGFLLAAGTGVQLEGHHHGDDVHDHAAHDHGQGDMNGHDHSRMVEAGTPAPTVRIALHPDGAQSRNLHIDVTGFTFDPEGVNGPHVPGKGHAHVYVDGVKVARAYGPWMQLQALPVGPHDIRVALYTNDHSQLVSNGEPIEATAQVVIE